MRLAELLNDRSVSPEAIAEYVRMERQLTDTQKDCALQKEMCLLSSDQRDLYARRCQIALAILRDDEAGLGSDQLNLIAQHIWPSTPARFSDPTQIPSAPFAHSMEPDFYVTPTWGEREGWLLIREILGLVGAMQAGLPEGFVWGDTGTLLLKWKDRAIKFCSKFGEGL